MTQEQKRRVEEEFDKLPQKKINHHHYHRTRHLKDFIFSHLEKAFEEGKKEMLWTIRTWAEGNVKGESEFNGVPYGGYIDYEKFSAFLFWERKTGMKISASTVSTLPKKK